jgi:hypothetical protein
MEYQVYQGEPIHNVFYYLSGFLQISGIIIIILILNYVIKLYKKIIKFLDKNS